MSDPGSPTDASFVSRFNRGLAIAIWALLLFVAVSQAVGNPESATAEILTAAAIAALTWIALWRPRVEVDADGVTLTNVARRIHVPWAALIDVSTRFALTLHTPGHTYAAWAAPAPGRTGAAMAQRREKGTRSSPRGDLGSTVRPGDLVTTESGAAADLVRERWEHLRENGALELGLADKTAVRVQWLWQPLAAVVVLAVAGAVLLGRV